MACLLWRVLSHHGDLLGSTKRTTGVSETGPQRYYPYGAHRGSGSVDTEYGFTGQREEKDLGLYYYNARWYDPYVGRFIEPHLIPACGCHRIGMATPYCASSCSR